LSASTGMRHRAAMGLTEDTDAVVVVVSEETGEISVAHRGHLVQGLDADSLRAFLTTTLTTVTRRTNWLADLARRVGSLLARDPASKEPENASATEVFPDHADGNGTEGAGKEHEEANH